MNAWQDVQVRNLGLRLLLELVSHLDWSLLGFARIQQEMGDLLTFLLTYLLTYSMEQSRWESKRFAASQAIPRIL
jgi:hypothetical protein